nr:hypothetical protein [Tanacetum cinerariifolium]
DVNVNALAGQVPTMAPPMRTDDQILPHIRWVPIGKSICYLDVEKSQSNPIYKIAVDILKHTNFFRASTASLTIPSIYIQQFWDTVRYDKSARCYRCQLDKQWFDLTKDTLRDALQITPVNNNQAFTSPPSSNALINFVNELGYPKLERRLGLKGQGLRCYRFFEASSIEPILIILRGSGKNSPNQSIHSLKTKGIWHNHKFHPRLDSLLHLPNEEPVLGYLKFSAKGTKREVFGMHIPDSPAPKPTKTTKKPKPTAPKVDPRPQVSKSASTKQPKPKFTPAKTRGKKCKVTTEISDKPSKAKKSKPGLLLLKT